MRLVSYSRPVTLVELKLSENEKSSIVMIKLIAGQIIIRCVDAYPCLFLYLDYFFFIASVVTHLCKCPAGWNILFRFHFWRISVFFF